MTPGFIVIGAPKAGTTSLWRLISQHPQICPCASKEPGFFLRDEVYARGMDWYLNHFSHCAEAQIAGEATTEYSQTREFPKAVVRIAKHLPDAKLIFLMRHPCEIIESRWRQSLANRDAIPRNFADAVKHHPPLLENALFGQTIRDYREHFPRDNLLILLFEDFKRDPQAVCAKVFSFLGVDSKFEPPDMHRVSNPGAEKDVDRSWVSLARRIPGAGALRDLLPTGLRRELRAITRRKPLPIVWTEEVFHLIQPQIAADAEFALRAAGRDAEFWDISDAWLARRLRDPGGSS